MDEKPNPFGNPVVADAYLRDAWSPATVVPLVIPAPGGPARWPQYCRLHRGPGLPGGSPDRHRRVSAALRARPRYGLSPAERARTIDACLRGGRPFAAIQPIDGITRFLAVDSEDRYASVAIVAFSFQHVAVAVATGSAVAVGTHHVTLIRRCGTLDPGPDLPGLPVLPSSVAAPPRSRVPPDSAARAVPRVGNQVLLNGRHGGVEPPTSQTARLRRCRDLYRRGGRARPSALTRRRLSHPHEVQALLVNALRRGGELPGLVIARHELAARGLLHISAGAASPYTQPSARS